MQAATPGLFDKNAQGGVSASERTSALHAAPSLATLGYDMQPVGATHRGRPA